MVSLREVRAACALLEWSQDDLAEASGVAGQMIASLEAGLGAVVTSEEALNRLVDTLEKAGIAFIEDGAVIGGGPGVRFKTTMPVGSRQTK